MGDNRISMEYRAADKLVKDLVGGARKGAAAMYPDNPTAALNFVIGVLQGHLMSALTGLPVEPVQLPNADTLEARPSQFHSHQ